MRSDTPAPNRIPSFTGSFRENLDALIDILERGDKDAGGKKIGFELERILVDRTGTTLPFAGEHGVSALVHELAHNIPDVETSIIDGHLLGLAWIEHTELEDVEVNLSLEPSAQLEISAGPAHTVKALFDAVSAFDAHVARALERLGIDAELVAAGYNPFVISPLDLELIPKERYRDMDRYLSRRGRYARDMMRCTASTQVSLDYESEQDAARIYRMATLLGPVFAFLFDNAPVFRGMASAGMARSRIWHHVDVDRCGIVPGSLEGLTFEDYILWVSSVKPILFTDEHHVTCATGDRYTRDIMSERPLTRSELLHLLSMVFPNVRLKGFVELREMDSLPPRLAAACTSFTGALFYDKCLETKLAHRLSAWLPDGFAGIDENDAVLARLHLEEQGWDATVYGMPVTALVDALVAIARENVEHDAGCTAPDSAAADTIEVPVVRASGVARAFDRESIDLLERMWSKRLLPRDIDEQGILPRLS